MTPVWLKTLYQKWNAVRGDRLSPAARSFSIGWHDLQDAAGIKGEENRRASERELLAYTKGIKGEKPKLRVTLYRHRVIEQVVVPLESEPWLMETFGHTPATELHRASLNVIEELKTLPHPEYPDLWEKWCDKVAAIFQQGKNLQPLTWKDPGKVRELMRLVHSFTSVIWPEGTMIRDASIKLGFTSKDLQEIQLRLESCLTSFFERPVTFESCGILLTEPKIQVAGKMTIHYADGSSQDIQEIKGVYTLPLLPDLERAVRISTPARRFMTVENSKTTLPALAAKNHQGATLLAACSFPNGAVTRLIELLPLDLPMHHFGDTDPAGFLILSTLRRKTGREIRPFLMEPRPAQSLVPLTEYDLKILPSLLADPSLTDVRLSIERITGRQDKGLFEQESLGSPDLEGWPFYSASGLA